MRRQHFSRWPLPAGCAPDNTMDNNIGMCGLYITELESLLGICVRVMVGKALSG